MGADTSRTGARDHAPPQTEIRVEDLLAVVEERDRLAQSWCRKALILALSLSAFLAAGLLVNPLLDMLLLIGVVFIHELGHYAGMRVFGYRDIKIFFIPFLGAGVSGQTRHVEGWKDCVVSLLGPLPGLLIGLVLAARNYLHPDPLVGQLAILFLYLNAFNLLPFYPLDGGRFLNQALFVRSPFLETLFRVLAGGITLVAAWHWEEWFLAVMGFFVLATARRTWHTGRIARTLKREGFDPARTSHEKLTPELASAMLPHLRQAFPLATGSRVLAVHVREVWERLKLRPPGWGASVLLLGLYGGACGVLLATVLAYVLSGHLAWQTAMNRGYQAAGRQEWGVAEEEFRNALAAARRFPESDSRLPRALLQLGLASAWEGKRAQAEASFREALALQDRQPDPDAELLAATLDTLAEFLDGGGESEVRESRELARRARELRQRHGLPSPESLTGEEGEPGQTRSETPGTRPGR